MIDINYKDKNIGSFIKDGKNFIIDYKNFDIKNSISLSLPNTKKIVTYELDFLLTVTLEPSAESEVCL